MFIVPSANLLVKFDVRHPLFRFLRTENKHIALFVDIKADNILHCLLESPLWF